MPIEHAYRSYKEEPSVTRKPYIVYSELEDADFPGATGSISFNDLDGNLQSLIEGKADKIGNYPDMNVGSSDESTTLVGGFGTIKSISPDGVSCASAVSVDCGSVTLEAGIWIVCYGGGFSSNSTGKRRVHLGTDTAYGRYTPTIQACATDVTRINACDILSLETETEEHIYAQQDSGSSLTFFPYIKALKIK